MWEKFQNVLKRATLKVSRRMRIAAGATLAILCCPQFVYAQADGDVQKIIRTTMISLGLIIVSILAIMIVRKAGSRRRDSLSDYTGLDLMKLKSKGLLTPEEMEKVSRSIARRLEEKEAERKKAASRPTPESLLLDPEVRRLQELAQAKDADDARQARMQAPQGPVAVDGVAPVSHPAEPDLSGIESGAAVNAAPDDLSNIELPPDVQQLADAGVLTPEEVQNVKRRLKARQAANES